MRKMKLILRVEDENGDIIVDDETLLVDDITTITAQDLDAMMKNFSFESVFDGLLKA